jgi:hypothetical protein
MTYVTLDLALTDPDALTFSERLAMLSQPIPEDLVKTIGSSNYTQDYIEWHTARAIFDFWFRGHWSSHFDGPHYRQTFPIPIERFKAGDSKSLSPGGTVRPIVHNDQVVMPAPEALHTWQQEVTGRTTITVYDPNDHNLFISHDGVGQDLLFQSTNGGWIYNDKGPTSAESHSFKRAATKYGVGIELYADKATPMTDHLTIHYANAIYQQVTREVVRELSGRGKLNSKEAQQTIKYVMGDPGLDKLRQALDSLTNRLDEPAPSETVS